MGQSTEELTSEIAGTRQKMASDLDALQDKVSPSAIVERRKTAARDRVSSLRSKVMGHAHDVRNTTASKTSNVAGSVQGGVHGAASTVSGAASSVTGAASSAASTTQDRIEGSPLAAGLVAFGAGMVIAGMFPATRREAAAASAVIETAQEKGAPLVEQAKSLGQEMGQDLKQTATDAAMQVKDTATESAARVKDEGQSAAETVKSEAQSSSGSGSSGSDEFGGTGTSGTSTGPTYTTGPQY